MRYTGSKNKLARREGIDLSLKTPGSKAQSSLLRRLNITPGQHGASRKRKITDYGAQLREKQKLKRVYGISETQMKNYFAKANKTEGNTGELLIQALERRLDNSVYRLKFAPTRASARQLVNHGHVTVNSKKVSIASYQIVKGDVIEFRRGKTAKIPYIQEILEKKDTMPSVWLNKKGTVGKVAEYPTLNDFTEEIELQSVIEFYSR
ncbi:30S ribosomal protein S4 [Candidatus Roizmanbacteria bacterium RIFCSPHIGHO2_02_FULL_40_13b]|uniref:Small ribosomal subunit protein uS4 n=1 Tax=Candidatus Roizmanbacteria bacterium RIFCSPHIGHO2_01_FULL_39_24 TaxID=1802032 RepID=A0A1F7GL64_9BACT|nr:MAG: 30S ribosomal protein S4 [Candidatus Roizmanbacteria bacterium RIFCSPHIGHO2_01_FULL_39_24]OGK27827.1 MAG: 30S ribosomal protein S4 [Candidatus Roizmanbacteria bacterium RIFCSPHIGHO2_02_FULL_40_13b]OGK49969.1 MAG: 30S ribosomal protein S4 [Candidatus Roizmanbacteria bacterium RIFCSPLOWO2_01_FULL_40_32]OGK55974.1 MAG: 30S ribosomal protein S4 [Candidatus Roizmanbacteria bacterium RIFCSPLOWO2_02_FULL_39_8]